MRKIKVKDNDDKTIYEVKLDSSDENNVTAGKVVSKIIFMVIALALGIGIGRFLVYILELLSIVS